MFLVKLEGLMDLAVVPVELGPTMRRVQTDKTGSLTRSTWTTSLPQVSACHTAMTQVHVETFVVRSLHVMKPNRYETG
jgi:hypothetical protein